MQEIKQRITTDEMEQAASEYKEKIYKFEAFISYRHVEPDQSIAQAVHKMIETFKAPKEFEINGQKPVFRVFRDREELAAKDLSASIEDALQNSKYLIVICSRRTPLSEWCIKEIETFRKIHGDERIIPVLVEGEPAESFPYPLKQLQRGNQDATELQDILAADLRPNAILQNEVKSYESIEGTDPAKVKALTKEALNILKLEKYRIMATILGCSLGDLKQRDKERKNKLMLSIASLVGAVFLLFGLSMANAYNKAENARRAAVQSNAAILMKQSRDFLSDGDSIKAILVAQEAMKSIDEDMENYNALKAEEMAIYNNSIYNNGFRMLTSIPTKNKLTFSAINKEGNLLAFGLGNNQTAIADAHNGAILKTFDGHSEQVKLIDFSPDGKMLASSSFDQSTIIYDVETGEQIHRMEFSGYPMTSRFSKDGSRYFQINLDSKGFSLQAYSTKDWSQIGGFELDGDIKDIDIAPDGKEIIITASDFSKPEEQLTRRRVEDGKIIDSFAQSKEQIKSYTGNQYETSNPFHWAEYSKDGKSIIAANSGEIIKYNIADKRVIFRQKFFVVPQEENIEETKDGKHIIFQSASMVYFLNGKTGAIEKEVYFENMTLKKFTYHEESNTLVAVDESSIAIWRNGILLEKNLTFGRTVPASVEFLPDGSKLILNIRENQTIKIVDIDKAEMIEAQLVAVSNKMGKALYHNDEGFFISDGVGKPLQPITLRNVRYVFYIPEVRGYRISDDGKYVARLINRRSEDNLTSEQILNIYNLETQKEIEFVMSTSQTGYTFTADNKKIVITDNIEGTRMLDIESQKELFRYPHIKNDSYKIIMSDDEKTLIINRISGTSEVYDVSNGELIDKIPGEALYMEGGGESLKIRGVYNNSGYHWEFGKELQLFDLDEYCAETPVSLSDLNLYHPKSNLLLMVRNNDTRRVGYVVDFSSGRLLTTLNPSVTPYRTNAAFDAEGKVIGIDQLYYSDLYNKEEKSAKNYRSMVIYRMLGEEETLQKIDKIRSGRELTEEEKIQIGLSTKK
ncbi:MAG: TIR domain-containing protein [Peptostreptococcaceae bacterium]|nr:TIR domain-containing protein [Peptostreptococcaceae bacterium]